MDAESLGTDPPRPTVTSGRANWVARSIDADRRRTDDGDQVHADVRRMGPVVVVQMSGRLPSRDVRVCRAALDDALATGVPRIVLNLAQATVDEESVGVLDLMNRYVSRQEATLCLTSLSPAAQRIIDRIRPGTFQVQPSVIIALADAAKVPTACHSTAHRRAEVHSFN
jgi:anti-anti-sigma regulatory factor